MNREMYIAGKNSGELYTVSYPDSILNFCEYDFSAFSKRCAEICRLSLVTGEYYTDEVINIRNSLIPCHKYYEKNIRTVFDKIVTDCWIDFLCTESKITTDELWSRCLPCKTAFEREIFSRICEYKHNQAINRWTTLIRLQQYALRKIEFIFGQQINDISEAKARENSFDLIFNVGANELGYEVDDFGANKVFSSGRVPGSPFIHSVESKEIMKKFLAKMPYKDGEIPERATGESMGDKTAMDAFGAVMSYMPTESGEASGLIKSLTLAQHEVYSPSGFKAVLDLEISLLISDNAYLQRCQLCNAFYVRDSSYDYDYCDTVKQDGTNCLAIMAKENPDKLKKSDSPDLNERCDDLYREMAERINTDMTQRDFTDWYRFMLTIKENILDGKATMEDFEHFVEYSRSISFTVRKSSLSEETAPSERQNDYDAREVRTFVFQRIDRSEIKQPEKPKAEENTAAEAVIRDMLKSGAIKPPPQPQSRIIRNTAYDGRVSYTNTPIGQELQQAVYIPIERTLNDISTPDLPEPEETDVQISDSDVKIYEAPGYEEKIVKVYEPRNKDFPPEIPEDDMQKFTETNDSADEDEEEFILQFPSAAQRTPQANTRTAKAVSAYRTVLPSPAPNKVTENDNAFAAVLGSIDRSDGFSEDEALDANGVPISHKTKHVMDAIFGPSKASPSLRLNPESKDTKI